MGKSRSCRASEPGHDTCPSSGNTGAARSARSGETRAKLALVCSAALLLPGVLVVAAFAQDEPPKVEAPRAVPPPAADSQTPLESAPQEVQKQDPVPAEKKAAPAPGDQEKPAPPAPGDDKEKAAPPSAPAEDQKTAPAPAEDARKTAEPTSAEKIREVFDLADALSTRYKFIEKYGREEDAKRPQLITQYRVGVLETTKFETDRAKGAPERKERSRLMKFVERAGRTGKLGEAADLIRRYDTVMVKDLVQARALNPPLLQGLTISLRNRPPLKAEIISLTPGRSLREDEFNMIQSDVNLPALTSFFSPIGRRVGETWEILPTAVQAVSGNLPDEDGYEMTGTLNKVSRSADGASLVAEIGVAGHFDVEGDRSAFNARIEFVFVPQGVFIPKAVAKREEASKTLEATGSIKLALLSFVRVSDVPETEGRLKSRIIFELIMERRPLALQPGERGAPSAPLEIQPVPKADEENSWVTYDDPAGRFHFRHPQELGPSPTRDPTMHEVELADFRPTGDARFAVILPHNTGDRERNLLFQDAKRFQKAIENQFSRAKDQMRWGSANWLDEEDWKTRNRKVFRMEGEFTLEKGGRPAFVDFYLVSEAGSSKTFVIESWIDREGGHVPFRNNVEDIIRGFQWSPSEKRLSTPSTAPGAPATPASAPGPAAAPAATDLPPLAPATAPNAPQQ